MNDYYPFGMLQEGRNYSQNSTYRYGFNNKENDNDIGKGVGKQQDYGMRIYDPRLGRFLSVDPIAKEYPELTPYQFAGNTPIQAILAYGRCYHRTIKTRSLQIKRSAGFWYSNNTMRRRRLLNLSPYSFDIQFVMGLFNIDSPHDSPVFLAFLRAANLI